MPYQPSPSLRAQLLARLAGEVRDPDLNLSIVHETLIRLRGVRAEYATDSDVLPRALAIARDLHVEACGRLEREASRRHIETVERLRAPLLVEVWAERGGNQKVGERLVREKMAEVRAAAMNHATESDVRMRVRTLAGRAVSDSNRNRPRPTVNRSPQEPNARDEEASRPDWFCNYIQSIRAREAAAIASRWMTEQPAGRALGRKHPIWRSLYETLEELASRCDGTFAFVMDAGDFLWCMARAESAPAALAIGESLDAARRFYDNELVPRLARLRRGQRVDVVNVEGTGLYAAVSFAGIYVAVVWFGDAFDPATVLAEIQRALPQIQSLTLALPPWDGPGCGEWARRARA